MSDFITNGSFTGETGWTGFVPVVPITDGWQNNGGTIASWLYITSNADPLYQELLGIADGNTYLITFEILSINNAILEITLGGESIGTFTTTGIKTVNHKLTSQTDSLIKIYGIDDGVFLGQIQIDDISVTDITASLLSDVYSLDFAWGW